MRICHFRVWNDVEGFFCLKSVSSEWLPEGWEAWAAWVPVFDACLNLGKDISNILIHFESSLIGISTSILDNKAVVSLSDRGVGKGDRLTTWNANVWGMDCSGLRNADVWRMDWRRECECYGLQWIEKCRCLGHGINDVNADVWGWIDNVNADVWEMDQRQMFEWWLMTWGIFT